MTEAIELHEATPGVADFPGATLRMESTDMLDRVVDLARESNAVEIIQIEAPEDRPGLPSKIPVLYRKGANPTIDSVKGLFEPYRTAPDHRSGVAQVTTLASFIALVNRHKDEGSAIFAQTAWPNPKLTAVINYHALDNTARYCTHRVEYNFPLTEEFKAWVANDGKVMSQLDFAHFLEDHAAELAAPLDAENREYVDLFKERFAAPNELIDLSRSLEVHVGAKIKSAERLKSGERSIIFETTQTNAAGEPVDIPGVFMISVPAFIDGDKLRIPARLRYRPAGQDGVKWFFQLYRWEYWLRTQVQFDLADAGKATSLPTFEGAPEVTR